MHCKVVVLLILALSKDVNPLKTGIKSLRATLPAEIFYWGF
jgi:hypothetical protein